MFNDEPTKNTQLSTTKNKEENIHIDTLNNGNMNYKVVNVYPKNCHINSKIIEKELYKVFVKYEGETS